jgi:hypothetical protein
MFGRTCSVKSPVSTATLSKSHSARLRWISDQQSSQLINYLDPLRTDERVASTSYGSTGSG